MNTDRSEKKISHIPDTSRNPIQRTQAYRVWHRGTTTSRVSCFFQAFDGLGDASYACELYRSTTKVEFSLDVHFTLNIHIYTCLIQQAPNSSSIVSPPRGPMLPADVLGMGSGKQSNPEHHSAFKFGVDAGLEPLRWVQTETCPGRTLKCILCVTTCFIKFMVFIHTFTQNCLETLAACPGVRILSHEIEPHYLNVLALGIFCCCIDSSLR